jgi:50S ribosomal protein L16 3-hydroxylase
MTYSIGFRAPKNQELATEFLGFLQDNLNQDKLVLNGIYEDADLTLQAHAAEIGKEMIAKVSANLQKIKWSDNLVAEFLGSYLSEPKVDVVFEANKKMSLLRFNEKLAKVGIALDLKSQMLFFANNFYINGETVKFSGESASILTTLADKRCIAATSIKDSILLQQLYDWYLAGYLSFDSF